jgi:Tol biopolymer transport system component
MTKAQKLLGWWGLLLTLTGCQLGWRSPVYTTLNSRYNDQQPALSGNGRFLALVSQRGASSEILVYDLQQQRFLELPALYRGEAIAESPSLSRTGRYLVYLAILEGRPTIALYDRLTKRSQLLTQGYRHWLRNPRISPDGRYVVFESVRRGQWDIEVLDRGPGIELDILDGTPVTNP